VDHRAAGEVRQHPANSISLSVQAIFSQDFAPAALVGLVGCNTWARIGSAVMSLSGASTRTAAFTSCGAIQPVDASAPVASWITSAARSTGT
jgi:hypothetical protein